MIYPIVAYGDPVLKKMCDDITQGEDIKALVSDMYETMYNAHGVGLAAPQIGKKIRLFVIDAEKYDEEDPKLKNTKITFVNPEIIEEDGDDVVVTEGCLSIPDIREDVTRPDKITIKYFDTDWKEHTVTYEGIISRIIQHEYDHIEGVLFVDYLSSLRKRLLKKRLSNISRGEIEVGYKMRFPNTKRRR